MELHNTINFRSGIRFFKKKSDAPPPLMDYILLHRGFWRYQKITGSIKKE
jgi:hypothetical protein